MQDTLSKITLSVLSNQLALDANHEIRYTSYYKKDLKRKLNLIIPILEKAEKQEFDNCFNKQEQATTEVYNGCQDMVKEIVTLGIEHFECITEILKAYKLNPNSINGIVNKINKSNK